MPVEQANAHMFPIVKFAGLQEDAPNSRYPPVSFTIDIPRDPGVFAVLDVVADKSLTTIVPTIVPDGVALIVQRVLNGIFK
jgi:hypothetical protein